MLLPCRQLPYHWHTIKIISEVHETVLAWLFLLVFPRIYLQQRSLSALSRTALSLMWEDQ